MAVQDDRSGGAATERTALLRDASPPRHAGAPGADGHPGESLDAAESDLLLARTASASSTAALGPEPVNTSMRCGPPYPASGADVEAPPPSLPPPPPRAYLIDTNRRQFWAVFSSVLMTFFVANFDGTIMASSHPVVTSYFGSSNSASWLSTAFLLTSTAFQPIFGRLSDTIGRKPPYLFALAVFTVSTLWCALAGSMTSFILARALCGLGAGGMACMGSIITSDMVDVERRGPYQSYLNIIYGVASALGAALGGVMADTLGWRWEFGVQIPPLVLLFVIAAVTIPPELGIYAEHESFTVAMRAFDFRGSLLLTASTTFLILGLNLGGNVLPWSHPFVAASLVLFAVCFPSFLYWETRAQRPIMPLVLLRRAPRANMIFANFLTAALLNAVLFNMPLFFQAVLLTSATASGLWLMVPTGVASATGVLTGFLIARTRRIGWPLAAGTAGYLVGTVGLTLALRRGLPVAVYLLALVPSAVGQGFHFPGTFLAILAVSEQADQAVVTSTLVLWRALGGVLGIAYSSLVLQNALAYYLHAYVTADGRGAAWKDLLIDQVRSSVEAVAALPDGKTKDQVVMSYEAALRLTFATCILLAVVSALLLAPVRLPRLGARK